MKFFKKIGVTAIASMVVAVMTMGGGAAYAAEVTPGTILTKDNIDKLKSETLDGHTIGSLLTEKVEWQIRNWGLTMKLGHSKAIIIDPRYVDATKKYSSQVKFDPSTREVTGYVAGLPFPDVSEKDPNAGDKIMWNFYLSQLQGSEFSAKAPWVLIDGNKGLDQVQDYLFTRLWFKNRLVGNPVIGDGSVLTKTLYVATGPEDVKGTGTFTVRYDQPRFEDQFAYIKSARRIRRLSGNAWMDPVGGLGMLNDDIFIWNSRPSWYRSTKLIGKRWILAITNDTQTTYVASKKGTLDQFPTINLKQAPYWNPVGMEYQPREVWVVEGVPPPEHPYSKKIAYVDTQIPTVYLAEMYDKKGVYWQHAQFAFRNQKGDDGVMYYPTVEGWHVDFKAKHAAVFLTYDMTVSDKNFNQTAFTADIIERIAK